MKLKSLILGSVAAAGLSTAGFAADLGVLTSLDVCDTLGLSGLTISSDTNCLQISGGINYEFNWGDYRDVYVVTDTLNGSRDTLGAGAGPQRAVQSFPTAAAIGRVLDSLGARLRA